jgi:hypothetical protein
MATFDRGIVATRCKDAFLIAQLIESGLNKHIRAVERAKYPNPENPERSHGERLAEFRSADCGMSPRTMGLSFNFICDGEKRTLTAYATCDADNLDIAPQSLSLQMGAGGGAKEYLHAALAPLAVLGRTYYQGYFEDISTPVAIDTAPPTFADLIRANAFPMRDAVKWHQVLRRDLGDDYSRLFKDDKEALHIQALLTEAAQFDSGLDKLESYVKRGMSLAAADPAAAANPANARRPRM